MVEILENRADWEQTFTENWLAHYQETGETDFKLYQYSRNEEGVAGKALDLSQSKLLFITTAGGYLKDQQKPFEAEGALGDYSIRTFATDTQLDKLAFAHTHYDHKYVDEDPQVLLPLRHLEDLAHEGVIGEIAPKVVSFSGYMPDVRRLLDEIVPQVVGLAKDQQVDAALLVPA